MPAGTLVSIPLTDILADDDFNCRGKIAPIDVVDLAKDIQERGLIQPVTVAPYNSNGYKYRLIAGFRRYSAHQVIQRSEIDAIIREDMIDERECRFFNLSENLQRTDLTIMQEARALAHLQAVGVGEHDAAARLNKSRGWIQVRYLLLKLPREVQKEVEAGFIGQTQIRELYSIYRNHSIEKLYLAVRKLKDAKILGKKIVTVDPDKLSPMAKRQRKRAEIFEMMSHVAQYAKMGLHTRCLAWCAGEISDDELYEGVKEFCEFNGGTYYKPAPRE
ncbi:MAG: ParB/RepB/Spo0J family partition protein [Nitrosopumilus sp.]